VADWVDDDGDEVADYIYKTLVETRPFSIERILLGYETLVHNFCDPDVSHLAIKRNLE